MQTFRLTKFTQWTSTEWGLPRVFYGGGKTQQSTSQVSIPPEILANYQNVNSIANQVAQTPFQQYSTDPNAFVAPLTPTQQAGINATNQYAGEAQPFYQTASNMNQAASNAGAQAVAPTVAQMENQFSQAQSGALGNAIQSGAFGGDRAGVAAANLQNQQGLALGQTVGQLEQQEQGIEQQGAVNEANFGTGAQAAGLAGAQAQLTAGQAQQQTEQAGETALYNQFLQQQSYPFQTTQFLGNIAEGTGALSGSTTSSTQPAPYFSDERLKEDMEPVGKTFDGLTLYKYHYKGDKQTHVGLSAQDVERKHPDAVGLSGGYKTVDYDAATRDAADKGRVHQGGLVTPSHEGHVASRRNYDVGGYAGLSPNAAWSAGFNLDPSYLQAQEAAYGNAPWGNAGPVSGAAPYGGKSHVPPSTGSPHAALAVAHAPQQQQQNGLQQLAGSVNQLEGLGKTGKSLYNDAKGAMPGLGGVTPAPAPPTTTAAQVPPGKLPPSSGSGSPVAPVADPSLGRANAQQLAGLDPNSLDSPDMSGLGNDLGSMFSRRGGRIQRDSGGATYQDASTDDESAGGDVPYDSGTGESGLDIPDDKPHNSLATSQPPASSANSGFNPTSLLGPIIGGLGLFGLANGGRVGLAAGGDGGDMPPLDTADTVAQQSNAPGLDVPAIQAQLKAKAGAPGIDATLPQFDVNGHSGSASSLAKRPAKAPSTPTAGLNPDIPSPDAQPVQAMQDTGSGQHITQPGEVLNQDNPGGVGDFLNRNQGLLVPALHGLGTMASSNSRYLGSAILQGLGGAADSYESTQQDMQTRAGNQPIVQQRQNDALQSDIDAWQSARAQRPELANVTFPQFEQLKASGKLNSYGGGGNSAQNAPSNGPGDANGPFAFTPQERLTRKLANGNMAYADPNYNAGYSAKNSIVGSKNIQSTVQQANHDAAQQNANGFTTDASGNRVPVPGYGSTAIAQNQPIQQTNEANAYRNAALPFRENYGNTMSLLNEMDGIYRGYQAGPTAEWRAQASKIIQDLDPNGTVLGHTPAGEDNDKIMKDIGQLTASRLATMSQGAPKDAHDLVNQFAATPDKSPGALRDLIIRGKAQMQQMNDYYSNYDPYQDKRSVFQYQKDFFTAHPFDQYRTQLEKATPAYAGQTPQKAAPAAAPAAPDIGFQSKGYRFKGGDPSSPGSWEKTTQ